MRITLLATITGIAASTIAIAQPGPSAPDSHGPGRWRQHQAPDLSRIRQRRADDLALLIGLRPEQRPALDAMLAAMTPPHHDWDEKPADGDNPAAPEAEGTLARLDHMSAKIDERGATEKAKLDTLRRFYASLSPDQKQRFDALDRLRHDPMGRPGGPGHGRGMGRPETRN